MGTYKKSINIGVIFRINVYEYTMRWQCFYEVQIMQPILYIVSRTWPAVRNRPMCSRYQVSDCHARIRVFLVIKLIVGVIFVFGGR
jgi:hypothetical protein